MTTRALHIAAAVILAAQAIVVPIVAANTQPTLLPVTAGFAAGTLANVHLVYAAVVLLGFTALCQAAQAVWSSPVIRWVEWSQVSAIVVFLLAQMNGIKDVAALVAMYAITAGASLFLVLHERAKEKTWPFVFGAAVAIVPWGIVALYQVGSIIAGSEPSIFVRAITIAMLVLAASYWLSARLGQVRSSAALTQRAHVVVVALTVSILAWSAFQFS